MTASVIVNLLPRTRWHALNVSVFVNRSVHVFFACSSVFPDGVGHLGTSGLKFSGSFGNPSLGSTSSSGRVSASGSSFSLRSLLHCACPG